jgi:hypothetical protein
MAQTLVCLRVHVVFSTKDRQKERHKRQTFEEELVALLDKYQVEYNERYIWS